MVSSRFESDEPQVTVEGLVLPPKLTQHVKADDELLVSRSRERVLGRKYEPAPINEFTQAYTKRMNQAAVRTAPTAEEVFQRLQLQIMAEYAPKPYVEPPISQVQAWELLWMEMNGMLAPFNRYVWFSDEQLNIAGNILRYFMGDPEGPYMLHKGLYVWGEVGVGKTILLKALMKLCKKIPLKNKQFDWRPTKRIMNEVAKQKSIAALDPYLEGNWLLDDLGGESETTRVYGDVVDPMDQLLSFRYDLFIDYGYVTHYTSNVEPKYLHDIYKDRLNDRFYETIQSIEFPGDSKRPDGSQPKIIDDDED